MDFTNVLLGLELIVTLRVTKFIMLFTTFGRTSWARCPLIGPVVRMTRNALVLRWELELRQVALDRYRSTRQKTLLPLESLACRRLELAFLPFTMICYLLFACWEIRNRFRRRPLLLVRRTFASRLSSLWYRLSRFLMEENEVPR